MTSRIAPDRLDHWPRHDEALLWMNQLIIDLKLQLSGEQPNKPIDFVRLQEWHKHARDIEDCKERMRFY